MIRRLATGDAAAIRALLVSQLGEGAGAGADNILRGRAVVLASAISPVLVWVRDHKGVLLNIDTVRFALEIRWISKLATQKICIVRHSVVGAETEINVGPDIPDELIQPLQAYLGELPGYDPSAPLDQQDGDEPSKQHGFAQFYFTHTLDQFAGG